MSTSTTWPGGAANPTPTSYSVPAAGEVNWSNLSNFLNALASGAQGTTFQKFANRVATSSPITVSTNDCIVVSALTVPGAVAVTLPAGQTKIVYFIVDGTGDAKTNNITITPNGAETINGAANLVLTSNYQGVCLSFNAGTSNWNVLLNNNTTGSNIGGFTASRAIVSDALGFLASATTTAAEIGYVNGVTSSIQTQLDAKVTNPLTTTGDVIFASNTASPATPARLGVGTTSYALLSTGTLPAWGQIVNASVDAAAAIAVSKLAALTIDRAVVTDGSGFVSAATTTATEIGYVNGVTSSIQTQLDAKVPTSLTSGNILVGSAGGVATSVTMSNDATIIASGALTIANGAITNAKVNASAAIDFSKLATLTSTNILVGSAGNVATSVAMTGDVTIGNTGVTAISSGVIVNADVNASAAIDFSKLATLTSANIILGSAGNVATSTAVTGDVTISNAGVTAISSGVIVNADVNASAAIAGTKIDPAFGAQTMSVTSTVNVSTIAAGTQTLGRYDTVGSNIIGFERSRGTFASKTIVADGDSLGRMIWSGYQDATTAVNAAKIEALVDGTPGASTDMPGRLEFSTTPNASGSLLLRGTIDNAGKWTIGTSSGTQVHAVNGSLSVTGNVQVTTPTIQKFTSGTGTYTTAANTRWIRVRLIGGGGGGGPGHTSTLAGGAGGNTTFGTTLLVANGGTGGIYSGVGGTGGSASLGAAIGTALSGGNGGVSNASGASGVGGGSQGASSAFGGEGAGGYAGNAGSAAAVNSGAGGGGGGVQSNSVGGSGGGAGGFVDAIIAAPSATYGYAVGAAGSAGTGTYAGGLGGSGYIEVTEYYV